MKLITSLIIVFITYFGLSVNANSVNKIKDEDLTEGTMLKYNGITGESLSEIIKNEPKVTHDPFSDKDELDQIKKMRIEYYTNLGGFYVDETLSSFIWNKTEKNGFGFYELNPERIPISINPTKLIISYYPAKNGFGAVINVKKTEQTNANKLFFNKKLIKLNMSNNEGRLLDRKKIRIYFTIEDIYSNRKHKKPTFQSPYEQVETGYIVQASVDKITLPNSDEEIKFLIEDIK